MKKLFLLLAATAAVPLLAVVNMPGIFSDHAVLAKRNDVPVFGMADPGETVLLSFNGQNYTTTAGTDGKWMVKMDLSQAAPGPHVLKVNHLTVKDILVGEVFLASGQSNMAFRLNRAAGFDAEKQLPPNNAMRFFNTAAASRKDPQADLKGKWEIVSPETIGNFSAVAYFFAKELQDKLQLPVGIINSSVGGTEIECWMSKESLARFPKAVKTGKKKEYLYESYPRRYRQFLEKNRAWEQKFNRTDDVRGVPAADAAWEKALPPVAFGNGIYFLRTKVNISARDAANGFRINLMRSYAPMMLYIDGKRFAAKTDKDAYKLGYFICNIPPKKLAPGPHEVIVRYFVSHDRVRVPRVAYFGTVPVTEKQWEIFCAKDFGKPDAVCKKERPSLPGMLPSRNRLWSRLFNGMINPLIPYKLSGVIWYQGESNHNDAANYRKYFPAMIRDWRKKFADEKLPFYFCQLAAYRNKSADPANCGSWPQLRDAQKAALKLPGTGMAVLTDAGEALDIHPIDKATPGRRLAALALKQIYDHDIPASGPAAESAKQKGNAITVKFSGCNGGLTAKPLPGYHYLQRNSNKREKVIRNSPAAQVEGFAVAGSDNKFFWADKAEISGNEITVSSSKVPVPVKIRFGWMENPTVNLYNGAGFPAVPFELSTKQL